MHRNTILMFVATNCSFRSLPAAFRMNTLFLGSTWWITAWVPFPVPPAITKSPTTGKSEGCAAWYRNFPETLAKYSPSAVIIRYKSFSCDKILPKVYSGYCAASLHTFRLAPKRAGSVFFIMLLCPLFLQFFYHSLQMLFSNSFSASWNCFFALSLSSAPS